MTMIEPAHSPLAYTRDGQAILPAAVVPPGQPQPLGVLADGRPVWPVPPGYGPAGQPHPYGALPDGQLIFVAEFNSGTASMTQVFAQSPAAAQTWGPPKGSGLAITAFVLGIVALLLCLVPILNNGAFVLALFGLGFGLPAWIGASKAKRSGKGLAVAGVLLSVVSIVGVVASQALYSKALDNVGDSLSTSFGGNTEKVLAEYADVKLGAFVVKKTEFSSDTSLPVRITNKSNKPMSFDFKIEALDASGTRIDDDTVFVSDLAPGQSASEIAFKFVSDANALSKATFKVVEASATPQ